MACARLIAGLMIGGLAGCTRPTATIGPGSPLAGPGQAARLAALARAGLHERDLTAVTGPWRPWQWIVLHHSATAAGNLASIDAFHRNVRGWDEVGYHFVIGNGSLSPDGGIEVSPRWTKQKHGAHCRVAGHPEYNELGIGICLVGNFEETAPTPAQIASARALVALLSDWFHIPAWRIRGHGHLANTADRFHTACPGRHFPYEAVVAGP